MRAVCCGPPVLSTHGSAKVRLSTQLKISFYNVWYFGYGLGVRRYIFIFNSPFNGSNTNLPRGSRNGDEFFDIESDCDGFYV